MGPLGTLQDSRHKRMPLAIRSSLCLPACSRCTALLQSWGNAWVEPYVSELADSVADRLCCATAIVCAEDLADIIT